METRACKNCKKDFQIEPDDFSFYEKIKVPPPTWCPPCRFQRRALFRNEGKLFRNIDGHTGKPILSLFPKEAGFPVYEDSFWMSDGWDPYSYGREFDRSRPFLAQLFELSKVVPRPRSNTLAMVRSEYSANASYLKDCYLLFNSNNTEDSAYGNGVDFSKYCFDTSHVGHSERSYESFWLTKCYDTHFSSQCESCVGVWFSKNCRGCTDCFGCVNLRNKSNCFFNEQLTKEEYQAKLKALNLSSSTSLEKVKEKVQEVWLQYPVRFMQGISNTMVTGEYITHSKNVRASYLVREGEDLAYCQYGQVPPIKDCMDATVPGLNTELQYETCVCGWDSSQLKFCWECWDGGIDLEYCMHSGKKANYLFGCIGVKSGEYAILNRRYSKEEFLALREEIKEHMNTMPYIDAQGRTYGYGEFFPPEFCPIAYNYTIAQEHFPLTSNEAPALGILWDETQKSEYTITLEADNLPDNLEDVENRILEEVISCKACKGAYRIIESELQFLRQAQIALPRYCVTCRRTKRLEQRNKSILYNRTCMCTQTSHTHNTVCPNKFETSYSPERPEIVYCEKCYQEEVE